MKPDIFNTLASALHPAANLPDLSMAFQLMKIGDKIAESTRQTMLADTLRAAVADNRLPEAISLIKSEIEIGNREEMDWVIGRSTVDMIMKLGTASAWWKRLRNINH